MAKPCSAAASATPVRASYWVIAVMVIIAVPMYIDLFIKYW